MHSIAQNGWPRDVSLSAMALRRYPCTFVLHFGEIDVRIFLGACVENDNLNLDFVSDFVQRSVELSQLTDCTVVICAPVPPFGEEDLTLEFPRRSSLTARINAHRAVRDELCRLIQDKPELRYFDICETLVDRDGSLLPSLTEDGFHLNDVGASIFMKALKRNYLQGD
jgi:lysophospholipase L1-like esterase